MSIRLAVTSVLAPTATPGPAQMNGTFDPIADANHFLQATHGPQIVETLTILGRENTLTRIDRCLQLPR